MERRRRDFIKTGVQLATGIVLLPACKLMPKKDENKTTSTTNDRIDTFGIQLYTLRDDMPKDPKGVLQKLASYGYKQIESFEGEKGIYWGMTNTEFKTYVEGLGMTVVSAHCDINKDFEKKANEAAAIGMKYLICPWIGPQKTLDEYKKKAELFNKCGETCKKAGIRFAYHNHDYSFTLLEGQMPQDVLMNNTDPALVDYQMDIYWVVTAGQDPLAWFKKYPNRFTLSHIKDRQKNVPATEKNASVVLGQGVIDWNNVLKEAKQHGLKYFIVEQEKYDGTTPLGAAEADAAFMKSVRL